MKPVLANPEGRTVLWYSEKWDKYIAFSQKDIITATKAIAADMESSSVADRLVSSVLNNAIKSRGGIRHIAEFC